ncbi:hypothetical protein CKAH01_06493 [Colletotrichum kahawae]|uniref:Uncharacterized protein n=1 Tax=Colletotrichum kahawae TaxID=34407 RepID=A0AAE0D3R2_COLKA|nr:hypothetical protein CKAH01_06493 [Colletotrichum kahawae]
MIHQQKVDTTEVSPTSVSPPGLSSIDSGFVRTHGFIPHDVTPQPNVENKKAPKNFLPTRTHQQQFCPKPSGLETHTHIITPGPACSDMLIVCSVSTTPQHASLSLSGILRSGHHKSPSFPGNHPPDFWILTRSGFAHPSCSAQCLHRFCAGNQQNEEIAVILPTGAGVQSLPRWARPQMRSA